MKFTKRSETSTPPAESKRLDLYQDATDRTVAAIESGEAPWLKGGLMQLPRNGVSNNPYHGFNIMQLMGLHEDPRWCTYKQAEAQGWQVRKGEKASHIFFFKPLSIKTEGENGEPEEKTIPILKRFAVFNFSQIDRDSNEPEIIIPASSGSDLTDDQRDMLTCIVENANPDIQYGFPASGYAPSKDCIMLLDRESYSCEVEYAADLIHQLCHWTGGQDRLDREFGSSRNSTEYAAEELRATMASAMVCAKLGIPHNLPEHKDYSALQIDLLNADKKIIFRIAKDAELISRMVCSYHPDLRDEIEAEYQTQMQNAQKAGAPEDVYSLDELDFQDPAFDPEASRLTP